MESSGPVVFRLEGIADDPGVELIFSDLSSKGLAVCPAFDRELQVRVHGTACRVIWSDGHVSGRDEGSRPGAGHYYPAGRTVDRYALGTYDHAVDLSAGRADARVTPPPRRVLRKVGYG
ncbi:MAG TPA: hypothetical protein PKY77_04930 [Phycisphaerae bacterium]|nr:hypothetical protein [Phycisphaerae bacterium]HRY67205.1 hypothetical protein [Phycisphaerae bacterium]HSA26425.1 hypothetical protein [Phycisphaerae bacterium]